MSRIEVRHDLELFATQVGWAARTMEDSSLIEIVQWICVQLHDEDSSKETEELRRFLLRLLRLDAPEQIEAERRLIDVLGHSFKTRFSQWKTTDVPGRDVDWAETYRRALTGLPTRFVSRESRMRADDELMGALRYQARQWRDILRISDSEEYRHRAEELNEAIAINSNSNGREAGPMTSRLLQRLRQQGPRSYRAAAALSRVLTYQRSPAEGIDRAIWRALEEIDGWWTDEEARERSIWDILLEFNILMAITQTAVQSREWVLKELDTEDTFRAELGHVSSPILLSIRKSPPGEDVFVGLRKRAGLLNNMGARNSQPDICLTFTHEDTGEEISVLGDSKRNGDTENKGAGYFRDGLRAATYYLLAYANETRTQIQEGGISVGAIRPTFTLFFRQGTEPESEGIKAIRSRSIDSIPPILALDIESHFGLNSGWNTEGEAEEWKSTYLDDWLACMTKQAVCHLCSESRYRSDRMTEE